MQRFTRDLRRRTYAATPARPLPSGSQRAGFGHGHGRRRRFWRRSERRCKPAAERSGCRSRQSRSGEANDGALAGATLPTPWQKQPICRSRHPGHSQPNNGRASQKQVRRRAADSVDAAHAGRAAVGTGEGHLRLLPYVERCSPGRLGRHGHDLEMLQPHAGKTITRRPAWS